MANDIKCPNCGNVFDVENVIAADIEQKLQKQYQDKLQLSLNKVEEEKRKLEIDQLQFEEKKKKENEIFSQKLQQEKLKLETEIQEPRLGLGPSDEALRLSLEQRGGVAALVLLGASVVR